MPKFEYPTKEQKRMMFNKLSPERQVEIMAARGEERDNIFTPRGLRYDEKLDFSEDVELRQEPKRKTRKNQLKAVK